LQQDASSLIVDTAARILGAHRLGVRTRDLWTAVRTSDLRGSGAGRYLLAVGEHACVRRRLGALACQPAGTGVRARVLPYSDRPGGASIPKARAVCVLARCIAGIALREDPAGEQHQVVLVPQQFSELVRPAGRLPDRLRFCATLPALRPAPRSLSSTRPAPAPGIEPIEHFCRLPPSLPPLSPHTPQTT